MSPLGPDDLVYNTTNMLGGGVRELVAAALAGDYRGVTIWPQDVERARAEGMSISDVKSLLDDCEKNIEGVALLQELSGRTRDRVVSYGERCSGRWGAAARSGAAGPPQQRSAGRLAGGGRALSRAH